MPEIAEPRHASIGARDRRPLAAKHLGARIGHQIVGEQGYVEIGPEPRHEEHHLRGDEQDHAVAQMELHDGGL